MASPDRMPDLANDNARLRQEVEQAYGPEAKALQAGGPGGTSGGMDPWQQTVETRLGDLRADLRAVASDVGKLKTDMATLLERISHLPAKGFIVVVVGGGLAVLGALSVFGPNIRALLGLH